MKKVIQVSIHDIDHQITLDNIRSKMTLSDSFVKFTQHHEVRINGFDHLLK